MLYKLEIENFYSIRDRQVLDLSIDAKVPDDGERFAPIYPGANIRVPKVIAIFGANGSGKTTVLKALEFLMLMIRQSVDLSKFPPCERFNDEESANRPMRFAVELGGLMNLSPDVLARAEACQKEGGKPEFGLYRYELEVEMREGQSIRISSESLRQKPNGQGKWQRVFERDAEGRVKDSKGFSLSGFQHLTKTLAGNHTVLSSFAKFQHPSAQLFVQAAYRVFLLIAPIQMEGDHHVIEFLKAHREVLPGLQDELGRIDVGIEGIRFNETLDGPQLVFKHSGLQIEMPWNLESHGTRAFIKMYPIIMMALEQGGMILIDEMDSAIHPLILPELIGWFFDKERRNKNDAQIWLSCHSASLLDDLTKEEIVICEKDRQGRTQVHSLMDVKVRRDDNHYRKYMSGAYGGVPYIG